MQNRNRRIWAHFGGSIVAVFVASSMQEAVSCTAPKDFEPATKSDFYNPKKYGALGVKNGDDPLEFAIITSADCFSAGWLGQRKLKFYFNNRVDPQDSYDPHFLGVIVVRTFHDRWSADASRNTDKFLYFVRNGTKESSDYSWATTQPVTQLQHVESGVPYPTDTVKIISERFEPESHLSLDSLGEIPGVLGNLNQELVSGWHAIIVSKPVTTDTDKTVLSNSYEGRDFFNINSEYMDLTDTKTIAVRAYLIKFTDSPSNSKRPPEIFFDVGTNNADCVYIKVFKSGGDGTLLKSVRSGIDFATLQVNPKYKCVR